MNTFSLPVETYERDYDIVGGYRDQAARYLQLQTNKPYEECLAFVRQRIHPDNPDGLKDPVTTFIGKDKNGDRVLKSSTLMRVLTTVQKNDYRMSPAMNAYMPESARESDHSKFIKEGVEKRKVFKKAMLAAGQRGDTDAFVKNKGEQENRKINNNSYSGATLSQATSLFFQSTHPSLTSTCRSATSYANAANEKILAGNRHYYSPEITKANILAIIDGVDLEVIEKACTTWKFHMPTPDEAWEAIHYSSKYYWESEYHEQTIRTMLTNMSAVERAAVVYAEDLFQLHIYNKEFVENFLFKLAYTSPVSDGDGVDDILKTVDRDMHLLIVFLHFEDAAGLTLEEIYEQKPSVVGQMNATARALIETLATYNDFIKAFLVAKTLPSSLWEFPQARRKVVPISDTDSTMFTMGNWVREIYGYDCMKPEATRVAFGMVFIVTGVAAHLLAMLSASMGVEMSKRRVLSMKNEFYFKVLVSTTRAKHYWAAQSAQEGNYFKQYKLERKGVSLRGSSVPQHIRDQGEEFMKYVLDQTINEQKIDVVGKLKEFGDIERNIISSIQGGDGEYTIGVRVKPEESYKNPMQSAYAHYLFWEEVFAPSFGHAPPPTYTAIKVNLVAANITEIKTWASQMQDRGLAERLLNYVETNKKKTITALYIPSIIVEEKGIPDDIIVGIDLRNIIATNMAPFYLMAESFQAMFRNKNRDRLFSDFY